MKHRDGDIVYIRANEDMFMWLRTNSHGIQLTGEITFRKRYVYKTRVIADYTGDSFMVESDETGLAQRLTSDYFEVHFTYASEAQFLMIRAAKKLRNEYKKLKELATHIAIRFLGKSI